MPLGPEGYAALARRKGRHAANKAFLLDRVEKYPHLVVTDLTGPNPLKVSLSDKYGLFMCAPFPMKGLKVWGFETAAQAQAFVEEYGWEGLPWNADVHGAYRIELDAVVKQL